MTITPRYYPFFCPICEPSWVKNPCLMVIRLRYRVHVSWRFDYHSVPRHVDFWKTWTYPGPILTKNGVKKDFLGIFKIFEKMDFFRPHIPTTIYFFWTVVISLKPLKFDIEKVRFENVLFKKYSIWKIFFTKKIYGNEMIFYQ